MRSLLPRRSSATVSVVVAIALLACARVAASQAKDTSNGPAPGPRQVAGAATKQLVQLAASGEVELDRRATDRLQSAQHVLFDGHYADALTAFAAVLQSGDARGNYSLMSWAQHGMALAAAFAGEMVRSRAAYDDLLRGPSLFPLADSIEAAVLTGRHVIANSLLDRFSNTNPSMLGQQYTHSFRALDLAFAGNCNAAFAEVARAPDPGRPLPQAIRGLCGARSGRHAEAMMLRDSVLTHPLADPFSWPMIVARGVAL